MLDKNAISKEFLHAPNRYSLVPGSPSGAGIVLPTKQRHGLDRSRPYRHNVNLTDVNPGRPHEGTLEHCAMFEP